MPEVGPLLQRVEKNTKEGLIYTPMKHISLLKYDSSFTHNIWMQVEQKSNRLYSQRAGRFVGRVKTSRVRLDRVGLDPVKV